MKHTPKNFVLNIFTLYAIVFLICFTASSAITGFTANSMSQASTMNLYIRYGLIFCIAVHSFYIASLLFSKSVRDDGKHWFSAALISGMLLIVSASVILLSRNHIDPVDLVSIHNNQSNH